MTFVSAVVQKISVSDLCPDNWPFIKAKVLTLIVLHRWPIYRNLGNLIAGFLLFFTYE
jgi:TRAP-type C4-dicarboxylate transport system permease large subunit